MAGKSDYLEQKLLDHVFGLATFSAPASLYVALFTTLPAEDGTGGAEVSGGGYARTSVAPGGANWQRAASTVDNVGAITFPTATADWGTVNGFGIYDAAASGNLLYFAAFSNPQAVNNGNTASINAGALDVTED